MSTVRYPVLVSVPVNLCFERDSDLGDIVAKLKEQDLRDWLAGTAESLLREIVKADGNGGLMWIEPQAHVTVPRSPGEGGLC
ncbi:hypothetical protein [Demequina phytophila]|uniref:hypothetical protein n=1 Tax=Demequina phytophila TaxID=1638981 RepID=UPI0007843114|nr:hypothetical protein [Demequina phytophila]